MVKTRILCLGNNTELSDIQSLEIAKIRRLPHRGLISDLDQSEKNCGLPGVYHSSVYDLSSSRVHEIAIEFGHLIVLPQAKNQYNDSEAFDRTVDIAIKLEPFISVEFADASARRHNKFFKNLVDINPSFCIYPFIELLVQNGSTTVCCRSARPVTAIRNLKDYAQDINYRSIRDRMVSGVPIPEHCSHCYDLEKQGIISARKQETVEWASKLNINSLEDLAQITKPVYYEVRASNKCNLQCRMCGPESSDRIEREYIKLNLTTPQKREYTNFDFVDVNTVQRLYVSGGEPLTMVKFYKFLEHCIASNKTNFEIMVNTNGTKLPQKFRKYLKYFPRFQFIVSIDGKDKINHYIRWPSSWKNIVENVDYLNQSRHHLTINVTVSIYNVLHIHELLLFIDDRWPNADVHCQLAQSPGDRLSAFNHPENLRVLENLEKICHTRCYKNQPLVSNFVDRLINHYENFVEIDRTKLRDFFAFNDLLDHSRQIYLGQYLPELEQSRSLIQ